MEAFERTLAGLGIDLARAAERAARHRAAPAQEPARVLRAGARAGRGLPRDPAHGRPRRLRRAVPRGRAHRALRERRRLAAVRVPPPRRQLGHRGLRVPVRAPDRGPGTGCATVLGVEDADEYVGYARASKLVFLRRYAAKLAYELRAARRRAPAVGDAGRSTPACWAMRSASTGRARPTCPTSTRASTPPTTCAPGRSRRTCAAAARALRATSGSPSRRRATCCATLWREGQRLDADELLAAGDRRAARLRRDARRGLSARRPTAACGRSVEHGLAVRVALLVVAQPAQLRRREPVEALLHLGGGQVVVAGDRQATPPLPSAACSSESPLPPSMRSMSASRSSVARAPRESRSGSCPARPRASCARARPRRRATSSMCARVISTALNGRSTPRTSCRALQRPCRTDDRRTRSAVAACADPDTGAGSIRRALTYRFAPSPSHAIARAIACASTGRGRRAASAASPAPTGTSSSRRSRRPRAGGSTISRPRASRWSIASGAVGAASPKRALEVAVHAASTAGAR